MLLWWLHLIMFISLPFVTFRINVDWGVGGGYLMVLGSNATLSIVLSLYQYHSVTTSNKNNFCITMSTDQSHFDVLIIQGKVTWHFRLSCPNTTTFLDESWELNQGVYPTMSTFQPKALPVTGPNWRAQSQCSASWTHPCSYGHWWK